MIGGPREKRGPLLLWQEILQDEIPPEARILVRLIESACV